MNFFWRGKQRELHEFRKGTVFYPEKRRAAVPTRIHKRPFPFALAPTCLSGRFTRAMYLFWGART
jgi:hypothetical protein